MCTILVQCPPGSLVPERSIMYLSKYNHFVDHILDRINKVLRKSYDPVNVKLQNASDAKKNKTAGKNKKKRPAGASNKQVDMDLAETE